MITLKDRINFGIIMGSIPSIIILVLLMLVYEETGKIHSTNRIVIAPETYLILPFTFSYWIIPFYFFMIVFTSSFFFTNKHIVGNVRLGNRQDPLEEAGFLTSMCSILLLPAGIVPIIFFMIIIFILKLSLPNDKKPYIHREKNHDINN